MELPTRLRDAPLLTSRGLPAPPSPPVRLGYHRLRTPAIFIAIGEPWQSSKQRAARARRRLTIASLRSEISVAVKERPVIGVRRRRIVTTAPTESSHRALLDAELHRRTARTERLGALTGVVIVRIGKLIVRISKRRVAATARPYYFLTERPCGCGCE